MGNKRNFTIDRYLLSPGRKLYGVIFEAESRLGLLNDITSIAAKYKIRLPSIQYYSVTDTERIGLIFMDLTDADVPIDVFIEEFSKIEGIKNVQLVNPVVDGFVIDNLSHRLLVGGIRAIIMREFGYRGFIVGPRKQFGPAGEAFLYYVGFNVGIESAKPNRE
ncbi:MAG: hypothetical protein NZ896_06145, partial [Nitrososphaerales archaeon]|nr:hypothetical protein [Nitrososphaerales archaeon]